MWTSSEGERSHIDWARPTACQRTETELDNGWPLGSGSVVKHGTGFYSLASARTRCRERPCTRVTRSNSLGRSDDQVNASGIGWT
jgi:hypothetical protein